MYLSMEGFAVRLLTLQSIGGHDVLLDTTHDLFDSMVESIANITGNLMGHTLRRWRLDIKRTWM